LCGYIPSSCTLRGHRQASQGSRGGQRPSGLETGRSPPPRASESLNNPISVAAGFHFAISRDEESRDPILRTTLHAPRSVLDDRAEAETYAEGDLAHFGPMWRLIGEQADEPFDGADLADVAERVFKLNAMTETIATSGTEVVAVDG
jgi:hypothetical protein